MQSVRGISIAALLIIQTPLPSPLPTRPSRGEGARTARFQPRLASISGPSCRPRSRAGSRAFTLLEILVSVALLSFIVLGLFAMFNQTQRAFRMSMTQSDILEAGRAVMEMMPRELEQATMSYHPFYFDNNSQAVRR